ncbi:MAG: DUF1365 domain-containing protein [Sphingomonadales bacterium]|jgi:DUF1365 family protein
MTGFPKSCFYEGRVMHQRFLPKKHRFSYRVFSLFINLNELDEKRPFFSRNRFNILSFFDKDHGARDGSDVKAWAKQQFTQAKTGWDSGPIYLLCFPRLWGYVFNPLSIYYAFNKDGALNAILYQVSNTFGESHVYLLPAHMVGAKVKNSCKKDFHVSPFLGMDYRYDFTLNVPGDDLSVAIDEWGKDGRTLVATQHGKHRPITAWQSLKLITRHPLMTLKVIAAIHFEALRLWHKGIKFHKHPQAKVAQAENPHTIGEGAIDRGDVDVRFET